MFTCLDFVSAHPRPQGSSRLKDSPRLSTSDTYTGGRGRCFKPRRYPPPSPGSTVLGTRSHTVLQSSYPRPWLHGEQMPKKKRGNLRD